MTNLTKNSTNKELVEAFGESINDGKVRIFAIEETKNPEYTSLFVTQAIKTGEDNKVTNTFLGWTNKRIIRCIQNAKTDVANAFNIGDVLEGFGIKVEEKQLPAYEDQKPKVYPESHPAAGNPILFDDKPVYEHTSLVVEQESGIFKLTSESISSALLIQKESVEKTEALKELEKQEQMF